MFRLFYVKVTIMDLLVSQLQRGLEVSGNLLVCGLQILARQAYLLSKFHTVVISLAVHFHSFYIDYVVLSLFPHQSCLTYSRLSGAMPWSDPLGKGCLSNIRQSLKVFLLLLTVGYLLPFSSSLA